MDVSAKLLVMFYARRLVLLGFGLLPCCGLFLSKFEFPSAEEVRVAIDVEEWHLLHDWLEIYRDEGLEALEAQVDVDNLTIRQAVFLQDIRCDFSEEARSNWRDYYQKLYEDSPTPVTSYLFSRVVTSRVDRIKLLENCLMEDPSFNHARIELLSLRPFQPGDDTTIKSLTLMLQKNPGLLEAWRSLEEHAVRHGYWDLAQKALVARYLPVQSASADYELQRARYLLSEGQAEMALQASQSISMRPRDGLFVAAAAFAELGDLESSRKKMELARKSWPLDPWVYYNLGLLGRDYLDDKELALSSFNEFLRLVSLATSEDFESASLGYRLQVLSWVRELGDSE